jgi:hypothetical protein
MTPVVHLHWAKSAEMMRGVTIGFPLCGAPAVPREELTAFSDDTTCKECLKRFQAKAQEKSI